MLRVSGESDYLLSLQNPHSQRLKVMFEHVKGHANNLGNIEANRLARKGCKKPLQPDYDWEALEVVVRRAITLKDVALRAQE